MPSSTRGNSPSCCALLNRCTSSTNSRLRRPACRFCSARAKTFRSSATPSKTADTGSNTISAAPANKRAMVVLPVPGGPHKMIDPKLPCASIIRNRPSGPNKLSCPTTSSSVLGRNNSASGAGVAVPRSSSSIPCIIYEATELSKKKGPPIGDPFKTRKNDVDLGSGTSLNIIRVHILRWARILTTRILVTIDQLDHRHRRRVTIAIAGF